MKNRLRSTCQQITDLVSELTTLQDENLVRAGHELAEIFNRGGQLILAGQGPLQAVAQQTAVAFSHRLGFQRPPLPAIALGADPVYNAMLLADHQPYEALSREYRAQAERDHMLLLFCTDPSADQIQKLIAQIDENRTLVMVSPNGRKDENSQRRPNLTIELPADDDARLTELGLICGHLLCELVEGDLFGV